MIIFPNCKINLGLSIIEKRQDGFHNIESVLYPIPLNDVLEIIPSPDGNFSFLQSGKNIPGNLDNNLVIKAYRILKENYNLPEAHIHLFKNIPMGAGLGGGSADAAYCINLSNKLFDLNLSTGEMEDYAKKLGSDCAFFIKNRPILALGKGDVFESAEIDLSRFNMVIIQPKIHISTPEAYSWVKPSKKEKSISYLIQQPVKEWKSLLFNDFEEEVFERFPQIKEIENKLYQLGAVYSSMSGSGSAIFGLFDNKICLEKEFPGCFYWQSKK